MVKAAWRGILRTRPIKRPAHAGQTIGLGDLPMTTRAEGGIDITRTRLRGAWRFSPGKEVSGAGQRNAGQRRRDISTAQYLSRRANWISLGLFTCVLTTPNVEFDAVVST